MRKNVILCVFFMVQLLVFSTPSMAKNEKIIKALKEALQVGFDNAVKKVGVKDGYFKNEDIKILLPDKLKNAADYLERLGAGKVVDELVKKMNRAAEDAAPRAQKIFTDAVKQMKIDDALKILKGKDSEATEYLKAHTLEALKKEFYPQVKHSMQELKVIKTYDDFISKYNSNPLLESVNIDISDYVTDKALDGLFKMVAQEEKKIRKDPQARATDLLQDVFGEMLNGLMKGN